MRPNSLAVLAFTGVLTMFGPLSTDMQVPALPAMVGDLDTTVGRAQLTISLFMLAFGLGQLVVGPLADRFGRKPVLMGGMVLFALASLTCLLAPTVEVLIAARFVQALGTASAWVLSRSIVRDLHDPAGTTRMLSFITVIMGSASLYAPALGGLLVEWPGWRAIYAIHVAVGIAVYLATWRFYGESVPVKLIDAARPLVILRNCRYLLRDRVFRGYALTQALMISAMMAFVSSGSFVFRDFGLAPSEFGLLFTAISGSFIVGSLLAGSLSRRIAPERLYCAALLLSAVSSVVMVALAAAPGATVVRVIAPMMGVTFALGFIMPLSIAGALAPHPNLAGTASALMGFQQATLSALIGVVAIALYNGTAVPMTAIMSLLILCALAVYFVVLFRRSPRQAQSS